MVTAATDSPERPAGDEERILVVCTKYVGDGVLAIPFLRNLRRAFPQARIDVLGGTGTREILAACPYHDEVLVWSRPERRSCRTSLAGSRAAQCGV